MIEVADQGLAYHFAEIFFRLTLGEDGMAESAGFVATFGRFPHEEDDLSF